VYCRFGPLRSPSHPSETDFFFSASPAAPLLQTAGTSPRHGWGSFFPLHRRENPIQYKTDFSNSLSAPGIVPNRLEHFWIRDFPFATDLSLFGVYLPNSRWELRDDHFLVTHVLISRRSSPLTMHAPCYYLLSCTSFAFFQLFKPIYWLTADAILLSGNFPFFLFFGITA